MIVNHWSVKALGSDHPDAVKLLRAYLAEIAGRYLGSGDMPLESMYRMARMASLVDGASEVHKVSVAKSELARYEPKDGWPSEHVPTRLATARARFAHLLEAINGEHPVSPLGATFEDGYRNAALADAIAESSRIGSRQVMSYR